MTIRANRQSLGQTLHLPPAALLFQEIAPSVAATSTPVLAPSTKRGQEPRA
jgi:hypothetical protein